MKLDAKRTHFQALLPQILWLSLCAFGLNLVWEVAQCQPFFIHLKAPPTWSGMLLASLGDVVLIWIDYGLVTLWVRNPFWGNGPWDRRHWLSMEGFAIGLGISVETLALNTGRWSYTPWAPRIGGISLVPVLQLLLLCPLTFWLTQRLASKPESSQT